MVPGRGGERARCAGFLVRSLRFDIERAAGTAAGGGFFFDQGAIKADQGAIPVGDFDAALGDVVADETAAEASGGGVGAGAVDDGPIEKKDVASFQKHGYLAHVGGNFDMFGGEIFSVVGGLGADDIHAGGLGDDGHGAVLFIAIIDGDPGGEAGAGGDAEVEIVLVEVLPAGAGGLEVEHGLGGHGFFAEEIAEDIGDAFVEQVFVGEGSDGEVGAAMGVHHAGVVGEGIGGGVASGSALGFGETCDGAVGVLLHEGFADFANFIGREELAGDVIALGLEVRDLLGGEGAQIEGDGGSDHRRLQVSR